jgi:hypothetical protein
MEKNKKLNIKNTIFIESFRLLQMTIREIYLGGIKWKMALK